MMSPYGRSPAGGHVPVLLNEVLGLLDPKPGDNFIDCTVGEGGHALAILQMTAPNGLLLGIDRDADMVKILSEQAERMGISERLLFHHGNFAEVGEIARSHNFSNVRGILFDFGLSSWQLEESGAGFSFAGTEPLDMRFDRTKDTQTAASIINFWPEGSIERILREFGEERYSRRIAHAVVEHRKKEKIETTDELVGIILSAIPKAKRYVRFHPATRTFQALRIAVNTELANVEEGLEEASEILRPSGRIAAISFHSLEDRIVKNMFKKEAKGSLRIITKKPIRPSTEEVYLNPRARSAKLRTAEKL
jgi:16S rRNA (cytosine1402-N4)-methyltransferase